MKGNLPVKKLLLFAVLADMALVAWAGMHSWWLAAFSAMAGSLSLVAGGAAGAALPEEKGDGFKTTTNVGTEF
jgi:hypothetical protein